MYSQVTLSTSQRVYKQNRYDGNNDHCIFIVGCDDIDTSRDLGSVTLYYDVTHDNLYRIFFLIIQVQHGREVAVPMVPILLVYPLLQKYFTKGVMVGAVKG